MSAVATLPKRPPRAGERLPASFGLSLAMHLLLFAALAFVVRWNVEPQGMVVAELWGLPASVEPQPAPPAPPVAVPEPEPAPAAEVKPAPAKPEVDIALAQEKKRRAAEEDARREAENQRKAVEAARAKAEAEKKRAAEAEKQRQAAAQREQEKRLAAQAAEFRKQIEARTQAQAGGSGAPGPEARGARGSGDTAYAGAVKACILPHIAFAVPDTVKHGQYKAEFVVSLLPSREQIGSPRLVKPSGLAGFDSAVERAIRRCDPFPPKKDGSRMEREITVVFDPVDAR
ncbi:MAG: TonB family protein [Betaproteobacteria bacterium]